MHYKNGRQAHSGDPVIYRGYGGVIKTGVLHSLNPGTQSCNGQVASLIPGGVTGDCVTIGDLIHAEDALALIEVKPATAEDIEARAGVAYDTYCVAVGGLAFNGDPLPKWNEFRADPQKKKQSDAWIAAAQVL